MYTKKALMTLASANQINKAILELDIIRQEVYAQWMQTEDPLLWDVFRKATEDMQRLADEFDRRQQVFRDVNVWKRKY
jgi:hypothetical protein